MVSHRQLLGALFAATALSAAAAPMPEDSGMVCDSMIVNGWGVKPVLGDTQFILERDAGDFTILPNLIADNSRGKNAAEYTIDATLTDINGRVFARQESKLSVPAGGRSKADPFEGTRQRLNNQVALFTAEIADAAGRTTRIFGIFGEAAPVGPEKADVFGMNVHFGRYDADQRWKLYPLLKKAGVSTVRTDSSFRNFKTREEARETLLRLKEAILGQEAFGFESMVLVGYFPPGFHRSAEKLVTAREWMELLARELKGRASFHYGNETNSGWGAFGAAADMAQLNNAMAIGTEAGDPGARRGSFGIAEGDIAYLDRFLGAGAGDRLDAICLHPYGGTPEASVAKLLAARGVIRKHGGDQQIWATEVGFHTDEAGKRNELTGNLTGVSGFTLLHQRQLLARLFVLALSHGIERIYWYDFYGLKDPETFYLVNPDLTLRDSYHALAECARLLKGARPLGGTAPHELIQRHYFRRADGTTVMAAWALAGGIRADFRLPANAEAADDLGRPVALPPDRVPVLGDGVLYVTGLKLPEFTARKVIAGTLDERNFNRPMSRFTVRPGGTVQIPWSVWNGSAAPVEAAPAVLRRLPGWKIGLPGNIAVEPGKQHNGKILLTVPTDAVPGVEYEFTFAANIDGLRRTLPYTVRVAAEGEFPYRAIQQTASGSCPMWNPMDESKAGTGNPELTARRGSAKIDGDLAEWKPEEFFPIDQKFQWILRDSGIPSAEDWSGWIAFRWDEKKLYAAVLVRDDELFFGDFLSRDWRDSDNMRLFLSSVADPAKRAKTITGDDLLLIMTPTGVARTEGPMLNIASLGGLVRSGMESQVEMKSRVWKNGYVLEAAVPFSLFNAKPAEGTVLGLNVMADDCDGGFRQHVGMTYYKSPNYWNSPAALGNLRLTR
jgi:hypothetical protein